MHKILSKFLTFVYILTSAGVLFAQNNDPTAYLNSQFPKLTELYRKELSKSAAHYIFAVDVSGSMIKNQNVVINGLRPFIMALPDGDRVDVIPFGTQAMKNSLDFCGKIDNDIRNTLSQNIGSLYTSPTYTQQFKSFTDINSAVGAITDVMQNNREYKINIIVMITDFRNEVMGDNPSEHKLTTPQIEDLKNRVDAATNGSYTRSIALHIDPFAKYPGTCIDQLKNDVFNNEGVGLEIVALSNPGQMISQWFEQLKREIMVLKLKAIIDSENRLNPVDMTTETNIDGYAKSKIEWTPSKLYPVLKIDSSYIDKSGFYFVNNKKAFGETEERNIEIKLGQIKSDSWGFHHFNGDLSAGISLPTQYDDELRNLGIKKPLPETSSHVDRWIFTFPLPFWLCCVIILLIIFYILWVMKAISRNNSLKIKANVSILDMDGDPVGNMRKPSGISNLVIGKSGTGGCNVPEATWQVKIDKVKSNPLLPWTKPYFKWYKTQGEAYAGNHKSRCNGKFNASNTQIRLRCGEKNEEPVHNVKIQLLGLK